MTGGSAGGRASTPVTVVVGNPKRHSRTRIVALHATDALCSRLVEEGVPVTPPHLLDLADRTAQLVGGSGRIGATDEISVAELALERLALAKMQRAVRRPGGLLVVASPTFKAAYTGLLKLFIDLLPRAALQGVVAVPLMTAASPHHSGVVETHLRPLLAEAGARVPAPGVCVLEADFDDLDRALAHWLATAVPALVPALAPMATPAAAGGNR